MGKSCTSSHQKVIVKDTVPSVNLHIHIFALFAYALLFLCLVIWDLQRCPYKVRGKGENIEDTFLLSNSGLSTFLLQALSCSCSLPTPLLSQGP